MEKGFLTAFPVSWTNLYTVAAIRNVITGMKPQSQESLLNAYGHVDIVHGVLVCACLFDKQSGCYKAEFFSLFVHPDSDRGHVGGCDCDLAAV